MSNEVARLAARVAALERQLARTTRTARLAYSSIEDGAIEVHDRDGALTGIVGVQPDGTTGVTAVNGPPPPTPSAPLVEAGLSAIKVTWDGGFTDAAFAPLDLARVQVHILPSATAAPDVRNPVATIEAGSGASATVGIDGHDAVWVRLLAVNTSGIPGGASTAAVAAPRLADGGDIAAGSVRAEHLDADAVNGKTVTGAVVQTATAGPRLVLNPASSDGQPALEMYSGSRAEIAPGRVRSGVLDMGSWLQPQITVDSPLVGGSRADITLRSPAMDGQGSVKLEPSDQTDGYAHATVQNGGPNADSAITLYGSRGSKAGGGAHSIIVKGSGITVNSGTRQMTFTDGVLKAPNIVTGIVTITPTPNTPTSITVSGLNVAGSVHRAFVTAYSVAPGTVAECSASNVSASGLTVWVNRTNNVSTNVWYLIIGS
ncbi:hypothetical protein TPA0598_04_03180 [Streptomyces lydicamycinicus]|uniref:Uncharacterized protein n=1 Tax=Streptomyces lydicamycinicus TaxID=1546107 RepID=A0A0P4R6E8_9ACTN|nr:hypothetical protein [Streptomyces lydicamycinicus]GAO08682.1 hypothetical protein TPA0598_04_03180 [Streptomyces lydicamycinicus]